MIRGIILRTACLGIFMAIMPFMALAQVTDVWRYQSPGDELYFENNETAAIIQSDGTIALLLFPDGSTIMHAQIGYFDEGYTSSIKSMLIDADGTVHSVVVGNDLLQRSKPTEDGFISLRFNLNLSDVSRFQHASIWRIETAVQTITYSLKGSRRALDRVLAERALNRGAVSKGEKPTAQSNNATSDQVDMAIKRCDQLAAHPNDKNSNVAGVGWDVLDGKEAVDSCRLAVELNPGNARMHFQLGRAYDKAGNPQALTELKIAAIDMRYPAAFNNLGLLYWDGLYTSKDSSNARDLFEQGMELGNISSKYHYALILIQEGDGGFDLGYGNAIMKDAADNGYVLAQRSYGQFLADGTFGAKNIKEAVGHLTRAADSGDTKAAYDLAQIYLSGEGVKANPALYLKYLKLAARGGHAKAKEELGLE